MSLSLSSCVLFIFLKQSVNGEQFLNSIFLLPFPPAAANAASVIVPLAIIYASL